MWIREKHSGGRWAAWNWHDLDSATLLRARAAVRGEFAGFLDRCEARGEPTRYEDGIITPIGFTPNDLVTRAAEAVGARVDFFTIRVFFQTIEVAGGTWDTGPVAPMRRLQNVLESVSAERRSTDGR